MKDKGASFPDLSAPFGGHQMEVEGSRTTLPNTAKERQTMS